MTTNQIKARLEYLRGEILAERISMSEILELADYAKQGHIELNDTTLLEWAGVPEHCRHCDAYHLDGFMHECPDNK